jgi:hypothetical protein
VKVRLTPHRPIVNPVLRLYFGRPEVEVVCNGEKLGESDFSAQAVGDDVVIWIARELKEETTLEIIPV